MWKEELSRRNSQSRDPKMGACLVSLGNRPVDWTRVRVVDEKSGAGKEHIV